MKKSAIIYIVVCSIIGLGLLFYISWIDFQNAINLNGFDSLRDMLLGITFLSVLAVIAESQSIAVDQNKAISIAFAISFSALLIYGMAAAAWVAIISLLFSSTDFGRGYKEHVFNTPLYKTLMNVSNYVMAIVAMGFVYTYLGGSFLIYIPHQDDFNLINSIVIYLAGKMPQILAAILVDVLVNNLLIMMYFLFMGGINRQRISDWLSIFRWSVLSMVCIGLLGVFLAALYMFNPLSVLLFFAPFMMFRYAYVGFTSIRKGYLDTIQAFSAALDAKDHYTIGHARRVEKYCEIIAYEMNLSSERTKILKYASLLHDIGKIGISEAILNKADKLSPEEYEEIKKHPVIGAQMLDGIQFLKNEVKIIRAHHVHYDGGGYPADAAEEAKILEAQILCVADSFDAMTSDRAYRPAMSLEEAIDELNRFSGTQFAPDVVKAFIRGLGKLKDKDKFQDTTK